MQVLLAGRSVQGRGRVLEAEKEVAKSLSDYYRKAPRLAKYVGIGIDAQGNPTLADCERVAQELVMVSIELK